MTRVAMVTLLVVMCTALILEVKSIHKRKRNSESLRLKRYLVEPRFRKNCRPGGWWSKGFGTCVYISAYKDLKSHSEAMAACKQLKGMLFYPSNAWETKGITMRALANSEKISNQFYWTSGHVYEYQWTWGVDPFKYPFSAPNWAKGQPDGKLLEQCIAVNITDGMMHDKPCATRYNYICKTKTKG
ncbi:unnamed protein product [Mytilus coruscus]|uniref:C-type lectin domain-containing protein n=1 Tax=Mytilus coruscus TaxID=42192 RepID=A0A6J8A7I5_MYTCO|nr:unnamed protein product [Mytilus coruscus]